MIISNIRLDLIRSRFLSFTFNYSLFTVFIPALIFLSFLPRCAHMEPPTGGKADSTGPAVIATLPDTGATAVDPQTTPAITFDEWIDPASAKYAVFISPAKPAMKVSFRASRILIKPDSLLLANRTYTIILGTDIKDYRGNPLAHSFTLAFSTGPALDSGRFSGQLLLDSVKKLPAYTLVAAYSLTGKEPDLSQDRPEYSTQVDSGGRFRFVNIAAGEYRIFAFTDKNHNSRWEPAREALGIAGDPVRVIPGRPAPFLLPFLLPATSCPALRLKGAAAVDTQTLAIGFSGAPAFPETLLIARRYVMVRDSGTDTLRVSAVRPAPPPLEGYWLTHAPLPPRKRYRVLVRPDSLCNPCGTLMDSVKNSVTFYSWIPPDSVKPEMTGFLLPPGPVMLASDTVGISLLKDVNLDSLVGSLGNRGDTADTNFRPRPGKWVAGGYRQAWFLPTEPWLLDTTHSYLFRTSRLYDLAGNRGRDTLLPLKFTTVGPDNCGDFSGNIDSLLAGPFEVRARNHQTKRVFVTRVEKGNAYTFTALPAGAYEITFFCDRNKNSQWDRGRIKPFASAEPFFHLNDSLAVRARWEQNNVNFRLAP
jgi:uncharacterized protein (DUF2141 family)